MKGIVPEKIQNEILALDYIINELDKQINYLQKKKFMKIQKQIEMVWECMPEFQGLDFAINRETMQIISPAEFAEA